MTSDTIVSIAQETEAHTSKSGMAFVDTNGEEQQLQAASSPADSSNSNEMPTPNSNNRTPMTLPNHNKHVDDDEVNVPSENDSSSSDEDTSEGDEEEDVPISARPTKLCTADIDQEVQQYLHSRGRALSPEQTLSQALRAAAKELLLKVEVSGSPRRSNACNADIGQIESPGTNGSTNAEAGKERGFESDNNTFIKMGSSNKPGIESTKCIIDLEEDQTNQAADDKVSYNENKDDEETGIDKKQPPALHVPCKASTRKRPKRKFIAVVLAALSLAIVVAVVVGIVASRGGQQNPESGSTSLLSPESDTGTIAPPPQESISPSPGPSAPAIPATPGANLPTSIPTFPPTELAKQEFAASPKCTHIPYAGHNNFRFAFRRWGTDRPVRFLRIYTPQVFDPSKPNKIIFLYHGRTDGLNNFLDDDMQGLADEHGYTLVAVDGLSENDTRSFTFPGSADGIGKDGVTATTCNTAQTVPTYCAPSCQIQGRCNNRCGFSSCLDNDIELFIDLVNEVANKYVCVDRSRVYVYGFDQGGMLAWGLAQDPRSAPLIAGIGAAQGLPLHDYLVGKGTSTKSIPAIGIYSGNDCVVPPGNGTAIFNESCDGEGYRFVDAFRLHRLWAEEHGCSVGDTYPAKYSYEINGRDTVSCSSHCNPSAGPPKSVDCRSNDGHSKQPRHLDVAMKFFEDHFR